MSILSSDSIAQACEPFGKYYEVRPRFAAGGICLNTLASHINNISILSGAKPETLKALVDRTLVLEAEDYIKRWHTRECEGDAKIDIIWIKDMFDRKNIYVRVYVNERKWMAVTIHEREMMLDFETGGLGECIG